MLQDYKTEVVRLASGERVPLLIHRASSMPHGHVADYSLALHRGVPINTSKRSVDAIGLFHSWADQRQIDVDARVGSGNLFTSNEITSLAVALWDRRKGGGPAATVVGENHGYRIDQVCAYLKWRIWEIVSCLPVHDSRLGNINTRLEMVVNQLMSLKGSSVSKPRGHLTEEQCVRLFEIVRPGSDDNPFRKGNQLRNFFVLLLHYELGVRKAEPLVVKGGHLKIGPRSLITIIFTPDDPKDARLDQPSVKTLSRTLPMSPVLATVADRLMQQRRADKKISAAARQNPFLVLSDGGASALSLDSAYDIFRTLRSKFPDDFPPDFAAHHLRRSWNHRFSHACDKAGVKDELSDHVRRYVMGWSKTSEQPANYNRKAIEEQAFKLLLAMQDSMTGIEL